MRGRRIFVVASFSGVAGALAAAGGCGVTSTTLTEFIEGGPPPPPLPPPAPVRPPPPATTLPPPPSPPPPFDAGDDASAGACPVTSPVDASSLPYQPPAAPQGGACSDADLGALDTNLPSSAVDDEVKPLLSASCAACVFTDGTKATWGPIPEKALADGGHVPVTLDVGGCYTIMTGSAACGKTTQNVYDCQVTACAGCPSGDATAYLACLKKATATGGVCSAEAKAYQAACNAVDPTVYKAAQDACEPPPPVKYIFDGPVRVMCIAQPDGGDGG